MILILGSSPRCGSTLLLWSLATHSKLKSAGEVFHPCWNPRREAYYAENPGKSNIDFLAWAIANGSNLFKVFPAHPYSEHELTFLRRRCLVVFLYRLDYEKQLQSWKSASNSGEWVKGHAAKPASFPKDAKLQILSGFVKFQHMAHYTLQYEQLVEDFTGQMRTIQELAGLPVENLQPATEKQS